MKVKDIMQTQVDSVKADDSVQDIARLIFGHNINGLPVCEGKKVVGFITEHDILTPFYPSMAEFIEDPVHEGDFEAMERRVMEILNLTAKDIMSKKPLTIGPDTPILQAQSLMFTHKVGRLPVVDGKGHLIGIVSKGDIFNAIVGKNVSFDAEEGFYDWTAQFYDVEYDWERRLSHEIPSLVELFQKEKVKSVLDVASSTGEHTIALAKEGFDVVGVETSTLMYEKSMEKSAKLSPKIRKRIEFKKGVYNDTLQNVETKFDAALFLGNALSYVIKTDPQMLERVVDKLSPSGVLVFQIVNFKKILDRREGFRDFTLIQPESASIAPIYSTLGFFTRHDGQVLHTRAAFGFLNNKWRFRGVRSTQLEYIGKEEIQKMLKDLGFKKIAFYGSSYYGPMFENEFREHKSDWLNVVAKR